MNCLSEAQVSIFKTTIWAITLVAGLWAGLASGQDFSYSGRIVDSAGNPLVGPVDLKVELFATETGGKPVVTLPIYSSIKLNQGVFQISITLSQAELDAAFDQSETWIQITDATNARTFPRQKFKSIPLALKVPTDNSTISFNSKGKLEVQVDGLLPSGGNNQFLKVDGSGNLIWASPSGSGDMQQATFDSDVNNIVDTAEDAQQLNGQLPSYYLDAGNLTGTVAESRIHSSMARDSEITYKAESDLTTALDDNYAALVHSHSAATGATSGFMSAADKTKLDGLTAGADVTDAASVNAAGAVMDGDFSTNGIMARTGAGSYSVLTDNSANWNSAYGWGDHSTEGYLTAVPWATPGAIGSTTPNSGVFTDVTATNSIKIVDGAANTATLLSPVGNFSGDYNLTLPVDDGTPGQVLSTNGSGILTWTSAGAPDTSANTECSGSSTYLDGDGGCDTAQTIVDGTTSLVDADFGSNGIMSRTGAGSYAIVTDNSTNWNTAFGWGDHGAAGYAASSHSHSNATTGASGFMSGADKTKLNSIESAADVTDSANVTAAGAVMDGDFGANGLMTRTGAGSYNVVTDNSANWNTAFGWGDHGAAGYLTSVPADTNANTECAGTSTYLDGEGGCDGAQTIVNATTAVLTTDTGTVTGTMLANGTVANIDINDMDAAKLTGTVNNARFSAYSDLSAESKVGTGAAQVAAGNHGHSNATTGVAGYMSAADKTKLNGIETAADVTDATNVAAAGAIMDGDISTNGIMRRTAAGVYSSVTDNSSNWNTAYTDRNKWDGGATGLNATTGRSSLGLGSMATQNSNSVAVTGGSVSGVTLAATLSANLNGNSNKITNLTDPTANADAATKQYVDAAGGGIVKRMFTTSTTYDGNLGGKSGADAICAARATAAALGGTWKALLSLQDASDNANWWSGNFPSSWDKMVNVDGETLLTSDNWFYAKPNYPMIKDEFGDFVSVTSATVWTGGIFPNATPEFVNTCSDWISNSSGVFANYGIAYEYSTVPRWQSYGTANCAQLKHLYCVEQ
jgi:uncharacterized protein YdbL (DUF1318 family)